MATPAAIPSSLMSLRPLSLPECRRLLAAYGVNAFGNWFGEMALALVMYDITGSVLGVAAFWTLSLCLPALVGPPLLAVLRATRPAPLYAAQAALFGAAAAAVAWNAPLWLLLSITAVDGIIGLGARALTKAAIVRASGSASVLREANALLGSTFALSAALGPALAGPTVAIFGPAWALALDAATFAVASVALRGIRSAVEKPPHRVRVRDAVSRLAASGDVPRLLAADGLTAVFFAMVIPVELVFITDTLGGSAGDFGVVLAAWGGGAVVGSAALARLEGSSEAVLLLAGFALVTVGYLGMGAATTVPVVIAFSALGGIGDGAIGTAMLTAIQCRTPTELQEHVNALVEAVGCAAPAIGFGVGGLVAAAASPRLVYWVAGLGAIVVVVAFARVLTTAFAAEPAPAT